MADQHVSKLRVALAFLKAIFAASGRLLTSPFKGSNGSNTYFKDVMCALFRAQLGNLDLAGDRYTAGTTAPLVAKYAKDNNISLEDITLPSGTKAYWFGDKGAKKTIVYFHGGGYVMPPTQGHFLWLDDLRKSLGPDVSVLFLAYDLAPEQKYPTQLKQAVELVRHLVETQGRNPSDLVIGGDSAGANLTLGLLSHIAHPHPEISPLELSSKFRGALLISPWVSFNNSTPAHKINAERDMFDARPLSRWSAAFLGNSSPFAGDFYNEPVLAAPSWWEPVANVVDDVLIWVGDNEILKDSIEAFAKKFTLGFKAHGGIVTTIVTPKAFHIEMIIERVFGYKGDSGTGSKMVVEDWVKAKL